MESLMEAAVRCAGTGDRAILVVCPVAVLVPPWDCCEVYWYPLGVRPPVPCLAPATGELVLLCSSVVSLYLFFYSVAIGIAGLARI